MKNLFITLVLLSSFLLYGQDISVPKIVLDAFEEQFPNADEVNWKQIKDNYQAEFVDEYRSLAIYKSNGKWLKIISRIPEEDLAESILEYINDNYELFEIKQAQLIINSNELVSYKIILEDFDEEEVILKFDGDGELIE